MDRSTKIVVSLTAIPPRFGDLGQTLHSLRTQTRRPDSIELTIPRQYRRFPEHAFTLPEVPEGVEIHVAEHDLGPASKVLPCAERYRGQNVRIIYCDDDRVAPRDWLAALVAKSLRHPEKAVVAAGTDLDRLGMAAPAERREPRAVPRGRGFDPGYRLRRAGRALQGLATGRTLAKPGRSLFRADGYVDIAEGLGGVSVAPGFFDPACYEIPRLLWPVDDIWLSGSLERQGIAIWADSGCKVPTEHRGGKLGALIDSVIENADRHEANRACVRHMQETYGIWR